MKKLFALIALVALQANVADAQPRARRTTDPAPATYNTTSSSSAAAGNVTGYLGFGSGAVNIGGEYEALLSANQGIGGYLFFLTEKDAVREQTIALGGFIKLHYAATDSFDLYVSPGFGIAMVDVADDTETTIGPSFRMGAMYNFNERFALGWEHTFYYNWFNKKLGDVGQFGNVAFRISL